MPGKNYRRSRKNYSDQWCIDGAARRVAHEDYKSGLPHRTDLRHGTCAIADMPDKRTQERAEKDKREGKAPTTQAGEFVREEIHHAKEGKHRVKSRKQAVAIGLSKARRAGVELKPPKKGSASEKTRRKAETDLKKGAENRHRKGEHADSPKSAQHKKEEQ